MTPERLAAIERDLARWKRRLCANPAETACAVHYLGEVCAALREAQARIADLEELVADLTTQGCHHANDGTLDSCANSTWADGLRELAAMGRVEIVSDAGRRVIARWKEVANGA